MYYFRVMIRFLLLISFLSFTFGFELSFALGFGPSKLHSYLNEPLNLEIDLLDTETQNLSSLSANLASIKAFKRAEMPKPHFLSRLHFEVKRNDQRTYIKITSADAMKEAFLDFLIDLSWPGGHSIKGYTILLDPAPASGSKNHTNSNPSKENKINTKNDVKINTKQNMESLFGPEDKTQIPSNPKIVAMTQNNNKEEPIESKQHDLNDSNDLLKTQELDAVTSIGGKLIHSFLDDSNILQEKIQSDALITHMQNDKNTKDKNATTVRSETNSSSLPKIKQSSTKNFPYKIPILDLNKSKENNLPNWLFWCSILAVLCIISLTIWIFNKYRLAKPRSQNNIDHPTKQENTEKNKSKTMQEVRHAKPESLSKASKNPTLIQKELNLKEELDLKLNLAEQYIAVGNHSAAKILLNEIIEKGHDQQKAQAKNLNLKMDQHD